MVGPPAPQEACQNHKPLNATVRIRNSRRDPYTGLRGSIYIDFGNTGFNVHLIFNKEGHSPIWEFDFTPEGAIQKREGKDKQYALTFNYALHHFLEWWRNQDNFTSYPGGRPRYLVVYTNQVFFDFLRRLLGGKIVKESGNVLYEGDGKNRKHRSVVDIEELNNNEELREYIKRNVELCEKEGY